MARLFSSCSAAFLVASLAVAGAAPEPAESWRLPVIRDAGDFTLTDQAGKTFRMSSLRGKVVLVSFVFTTCSGACPATTHRLALIERELRQRGMLSNVHIVSITLDPERDTADALQRYMSLYDIEPAHWTFLTGPLDEVRKVHARWGMWAKPAANGQLDHPSRVFLVDQRGRLREIYNLDFLRPAWVVEDIARLLQD